MIREKEADYMLMRASHQEDTITGLYTPNVRLSKFIK